MKSNFLHLVGLSVGLSVVNIHAQIPDIPSPNGYNFAVELYEIESPKPFDQNSVDLYSKSVDKLFTNEENTVNAYPVLYAKPGVMVENDQTEAIMFPESFNVVNGKPIPIETLQHIGSRTRVTILETPPREVTFLIDFHYQRVKGYDKYNIGKDLAVEMPYFEMRKVNTQLTQTLGSWVVLGGIESKAEGKLKTTYYVIRISHPSY